MLSTINKSLYSKNDNSKLNIVLNALILVIIVALFFEVIFTAKFSGIYVVGSSMEPTLNGATEVDSGIYRIADTSGDYVYVDKNAEPDYGDIVVILKNSSTTIIKRVVALGGDYVKLVNGNLYIKHSLSEEFMIVNEDYVSPTNNNPIKNNFHNDDEGFYVDEGCIFVLGDNRNVSLDSRSSGNFKLSQVYGVVTDWSFNNKAFFTALHKYFSFDLPACFGIDNRIKVRIG